MYSDFVSHEDLVVNVGPDILPSASTKRAVAVKQREQSKTDLWNLFVDNIGSGTWRVGELAVKATAAAVGCRISVLSDEAQWTDQHYGSCNANRHIWLAYLDRVHYVPLHAIEPVPSVASTIPSVGRAPSVGDNASRPLSDANRAVLRSVKQSFRAMHRAPSAVRASETACDDELRGHHHAAEVNADALAKSAVIDGVAVLDHGFHTGAAIAADQRSPVGSVGSLLDPPCTAAVPASSSTVGGFAGREPSGGAGGVCTIGNESLPDRAQTCGWDAMMNGGGGMHGGLITTNSIPFNFGAMPCTVSPASTRIDVLRLRRTNLCSPSTRRDPFTIYPPSTIGSGGGRIRPREFVDIDIAHDALGDDPADVLDSQARERKKSRHEQSKAAG